MPTAQYGFNGNPSSVSVKTGSYTIPANNYAYVTAQVLDASTFSVDGTVLLDSAVDAYSTVNVDNGGGSSAASYTVSSGSRFSGQVYSGASVALTVGSSFGSQTGVISGLSLGPGSTVSWASGVSTQKTISGFEVNQDGRTSSTASLWVPAGTVLTTSSGRYLVQLF